MEALAADLIISRSKLPKEEQNLTQKEKTKKSDFERVYYMSVRNEAQISDCLPVSFRKLVNCLGVWMTVWGFNGLSL